MYWMCPLIVVSLEICGAGCRTCAIMVLVKKEGWLHKVLSWSLKITVTLNEIRIKSVIWSKMKAWLLSWKWFNKKQLAYGSTCHAFQASQPTKQRKVVCAKRIEMQKRKRSKGGFNCARLRWGDVRRKIFDQILVFLWGSLYLLNFGKKP